MISALFSRGADGLPAPVPLDFATLQLPPSPNTCLLTPSVAPGQGTLLLTLKTLIKQDLLSILLNLLC